MGAHSQRENLKKTQLNLKIYLAVKREKDKSSVIASYISFKQKLFQIMLWQYGLQITIYKDIKSEKSIYV